MIAIEGTDPTALYVELWKTVLEKGDEVHPRGKYIKEIRPVCVEFKNPLNRVTFIPGRRINPFFQVAESFWILSGGADVEWPEIFNSGISQFSDDGVWFNAPYGERLRYWNRNMLHNIIINPQDQLYDVLQKFKADKDTRQAVAVLSNPMFDNAGYTIDEQGRDICCNLVLTFKIRQNKLHLSVFNRSNDLHWGLFGANLCQFSTILEQMTSWLREYYPELEVGTYTHLTDSLHIYMEDYGAKSISSEPPTDGYKFEFKDEPRMKNTFEQFTELEDDFEYEIKPLFIQLLNNIHPALDNDDMLRYVILKHLETSCNDPYWEFVFKALYAYVLVKRGDIVLGLTVFKDLPSSQWKVSMMYFLKKFILKALREDSDVSETDVLPVYNSIVDELVKDTLTQKDNLKTYLTLQA